MISPGVGNSSPLQCSFLDKSMNRGAWRAQSVGCNVEPGHRHARMRSWSHCWVTAPQASQKRESAIRMQMATLPLGHFPIKTGITCYQLYVEFKWMTFSGMFGKSSLELRWSISLFSFLQAVIYDSYSLALCYQVFKVH